MNSSSTDDSHLSIEAHQLSLLDGYDEVVNVLRPLTDPMPEQQRRELVDLGARAWAVATKDEKVAMASSIAAKVRHLGGAS